MSAAIDFILFLLCLKIALEAIRVRNDLVFSGFLWVAATAFVGTLDLAGVPTVHSLHVWLDRVSRGPGTLAMALGVFHWLHGPFPAARWTAHFLAVGGSAITYYLSDRPWSGNVDMCIGAVLLLSLILLSFRHYKRRNRIKAGAALISAALLAFVGVGLSRIQIPAESPIRHIDVLHLTLIVAYSLMWACLGRTTEAHSPTPS